MNSHYRLMTEARNANKAFRTSSIPAKKYNRSQASATRYNTSTSSSTHSWNEAVDVVSNYEDMEAAFWS